MAVSPARPAIHAEAIRDGVRSASGLRPAVVRHPIGNVSEGELDVQTHRFGVDGREGGREAVALARLLVAVGGKLTLAYVVARDANAHRGSSDAPEASDGGRADALLEAVRGETGVEAQLRWNGPLL